MSKTVEDYFVEQQAIKNRFHPDDSGAIIAMAVLDVAAQLSQLNKNLVAFHHDKLDGAI